MLQVVHPNAMPIPYAMISRNRTNDVQSRPHAISSLMVLPLRTTFSLFYHLTTSR